MSSLKLIAGSRIGPFPYHIVAPLSENQGNMSEVFSASVGSVKPTSRIAGQNAQTPGTNLVVIKVARIKEEHQAFFRQTMDNEVERLRRLKHPGIVRIFPIQREGGIPNLTYTAEATGLPGRPWFTVLEYLSGGSLTGLIKEGRLSIGATLEIVRSLAATLDYLHSRNQVHLDIKPENVLFRSSPTPGEPSAPVLIDFGIARDIGQSGLEARTLHYAAPERVKISRQAEKPIEMMARPHPSMDIYALGVVLYELLTGKLPFNSRSQRSLTSEILRANPILPSKYEHRVNADLDAVVLKMLDKEAERRPTAEQTAIMLEEIAIKGQYLPRYTSHSGRLGNASVAAPPARKKRLGWLLSSLLALLVLLQFFLIMGTYRYWQEDIALNAVGIGDLATNARVLVAERIEAAGVGLINSIIGTESVETPALTPVPTLRPPTPLPPVEGSNNQ